MSNYEIGPTPLYWQLVSPYKIEIRRHYAMKQAFQIADSFLETDPLTLAMECFVNDKILDFPGGAYVMARFQIIAAGTNTVVDERSAGWANISELGNYFYVSLGNETGNNLSTPLAWGITETSHHGVPYFGFRAMIGAYELMQPGSSATIIVPFQARAFAVSDIFWFQVNHYDFDWM